MREKSNRLAIAIQGLVQGVGFRPFIYRLAIGLQLTGWVNNTASGVFIEVEGPVDRTQAFLSRLPQEIPPQAAIHQMETRYLDPVGYTRFEIIHSDETGDKKTLILPDLATCPDCLADVFDPNNRRYLYPFTNCTNCGPRFTIIERLPYDRPHTTMAKFTMCPHCQTEYDNPLDRRFHAQPNACPVCGPQVELWNKTGQCLLTRQEAMLQTVSEIKDGQILAIKGLGGFHLVVDAQNEDAVRELRRRKNREEKPFALIYSSLADVQKDCDVSELEVKMLTSSSAPIVLLQSKKSTRLPDLIAPCNPYLGVMLPYTPLHHILLRELGGPIVATSGNLSDEPICIDEYEALERLSTIADFFLVHNRPIVRHVDDSLVRCAAGREMVLRRARGLAPLPIYLKSFDIAPDSVLAVGAHLKNTIAITHQNMVFMSQHIGDLETKLAYNAFQHAIHDLNNLYDLKNKTVISDLHPDYLSSGHAQKLPMPHRQIQHHYAHIVSCMAENDLHGEVLGVAWDGTGLGLDGTIWGSEFLLANEHTFWRAACLRNFPLPGGDTAVKEIWRSAIGMLYEMKGAEYCREVQRKFLPTIQENKMTAVLTMLRQKINTPQTSSMGRFFDAVAALIGIRQEVRHEGQAAMALEFAISQQSPATYPFAMNAAETPFRIDWQPILEAALTDMEKGRQPSEIAVKFHNTLVEMILHVAIRMSPERIVLSGGCFQNQYLLENTVRRLAEAGFKPYWHQRAPTNDGGICLGQAAWGYYHDG